MSCSKKFHQEVDILYSRLSLSRSRRDHRNTSAHPDFDSTKLADYEKEDNQEMVRLKQSGQSRVLYGLSVLNTLGNVFMRVCY